jgi:spore coat polysaccharide biosynthesis protein SpsF
MGSTRLPGKVLKTILGRTVLDLFLERMRRSRQVKEIIVATTPDSANEAIVKLAGSLGHPVFRGSEDDVLDRFVQCARAHSLDWIVRVTSDCPAIDASLVDEAVAAALSDRRLKIVMNNLPRTYPHGMDVEVVAREALEAAWSEGKESAHREHVTAFVRERPDRFPQLNLPCPDGNHSDLRITLDTPADLKLLTALFEDLYPANPGFSWRDVVAAYRRHPKWRSMNPAP